MSKTIIRKALLFILVVITLITTPTRVYAEPITPTGIPILKVGNHVDDLVAHHMRESSISPGVAVAISHRTTPSRGGLKDCPYKGPYYQQRLKA